MVRSARIPGCLAMLGIALLTTGCAFGARTETLTPPDTKVRELHRQGYRLLNQGDREQTKATFEEARRRAESLDDLSGLALALNGLGAVATEEGKLTEAADLHRRALAITENLDQPDLVTDSLLHLGTVLQLGGEARQAQDLYERALGLARQTGNQGSEAVLLNKLGLLEKQLGDFSKAKASFEAALVINQALGDKPAQRQTLANLGLIAEETGKLEEASRRFEAKLELDMEAEDQPAIAADLTHLARIAEKQNRKDLALLYAESAAFTYRALGDAAHAHEEFQHAQALSRELAERQEQPPPPDVSLAKPAQAASPAAEPFKLADFGIKGKLTLKNFSHYFQTRDDNRNFGDEAILHLQWTRRFSEWARFNIMGEARQDDRRFTRGVRTRVPDNLLHRRMIDVKEATLKFNLPLMELSLGKQFFTWGTADAYNPTDNMNPYDYLDVIDREKMPVYSASAALDAGPVNVTFIVIPFFTPSRDPLVESRWNLELTPGGGIVEQRLVAGRDLSNMQYAVRAKTTVAGWDLSVSYFDGFEYVPVVKQQVGIVGGSLGQIFTPVYRHMQVPGFDFSTTFDKFEFHGEGAFKFENRDIKDSRFQGSLGLNYTWDDLGIKGLENIMFIVEHNREQFLSPKNPNFIVVANFINAFRNAVSGRVRFKFNEETQFAVSETIDFSKEANYFLQFKLNHKFTDDLHIETGFDNFAGVKDSFWGKWRDNDRFFFFMRRFF